MEGLESLGGLGGLGGLGAAEPEGIDPGRNEFRRMALIAKSGNFLIGDRTLINEGKQLSVPISLNGNIVDYLVGGEHEGVLKRLAKILQKKA